MSALSLEVSMGMARASQARTDARTEGASEVSGARGAKPCAPRLTISRPCFSSRCSDQVFSAKW